MLTGFGKMFSSPINVGKIDEGWILPAAKVVPMTAFSVLESQLVNNIYNTQGRKRLLLENCKKNIEDYGYSESVSLSILEDDLGIGK